MTFPFADYEAGKADHIAVFADWLVRAVAAGAPELAIEDDEVRALLSRLAAEGYIYSRTDKLKRTPGEPLCKVIYTHSPTDLVITVDCKLPDGRNVSRTLKEHPFIRDELVYGRGIRRCIVGDGDELVVETKMGVTYSKL